MATALPAITAALRIDRWLWCARFFKSRSIAAQAVRAGHVRINGRRVKPAYGVKIGDSLTIDRADTECAVTVTGIPARRGPANEARACYAEHPDSIERRRRAVEYASERTVQPPTRGRPDKKTRRLLLEIRERR